MEEQWNPEQAENSAWSEDGQGTHRCMDNFGRLDEQGEVVFASLHDTHDLVVGEETHAWAGGGGEQAGRSSAGCIGASLFPA